MDDEPVCQCEEGAPAWMATFSDLATLMLCFFVLLLSFANMDVQNFRTALGSVKDALGVQFKVNGKFEALSSSPIEMSQNQGSDTLTENKSHDEEVRTLIEAFVAARGIEEVNIEVETDGNIITVRANDFVLFGSGDAELQDAGKPLLDAMYELLESFEGEMSVEGHTDNRPISSSVYPSNWELSSARASAVLRYFLSQGMKAGMIHVAGYSDTRPLANNDTVEGRNRNRRVEFLFELPDREAGNPLDAFQFDKQVRAKEGEKLSPKSDVENPASDGKNTASPDEARKEPSVAPAPEESAEPK